RADDTVDLGEGAGEHLVVDAAGGVDDERDPRDGSVLPGQDDPAQRAGTSRRSRIRVVAPAGRPPDAPPDRPGEQRLPRHPGREHLLDPAQQATRIGVAPMRLVAVVDGDPLADHPGLRLTDRADVGARTMLMLPGYAVRTAPTPLTGLEGSQVLAGQGVHPRLHREVLLGGAPRA